jgi:glycosyltransferase involved in cell wall biosynthesis
METTITVGICARNSEKTLSKALDSVVNQDFPHEKMQIILVDDGSTDNTFQIMIDYVRKMDIETKVIQTSWKGIGHARNLVLENTASDYLIWVDSDEILSSSYIRDQVDFMEKNNDVGITTGLVSLVPGNLVLNLELIPGIVTHFNYQKPRNFIWKTESLPGTGASTFRVKALRQANGFNKRLKVSGEDVEVAYRMRSAGWLVKFNSAQYYELSGGMSNFKDLWTKYTGRGYGSEKIYRENRNVFSFPRMSPIAGLLAGFLCSLKGYELIRQKRVFLLSVHYGIKMTAWMFGFIRSQIDSTKRKPKSA